MSGTHFLPLQGGIGPREQESRTEQHTVLGIVVFAVHGEKAQLLAAGGQIDFALGPVESVGGDVQQLCGAGGKLAEGVFSALPAGVEGRVDSVLL